MKKYLLTIILLTLMACQNEKIVGPISDDKGVPGTINNVKVENLHGGAKISYSLPEASDLFYVEADYEIKPGIQEQMKSSYYNNYLVIQGFGDTNEHEVKLYTVDRSGNRSQPVSAMVKPLIPPVRQSYATLVYNKDFGGIHVSFKNPNSADLVVNIMIKDSTGDWADYDKYYSSLPDNVFSVRGLPAVPTSFGLFLKDRWDNHSDTLIKKLTPIFEIELDKSKFKDMSKYLPGTPEPYSGSYTMPHLWDNNINSMYHTSQDVSEGAQFPLHFAFDLGVKAKLSRMKLWPRQGERWIYSHGNVKDAIIYGTNKDPGTWNPFNPNDWIKLGEYHCDKPSGLPSGQVAQEDQERAKEGQSIEFPISDPPVRYIMLKVIDNWSQPPNATGGFAHIAEVTFFGQPQP